MKTLLVGVDWGREHVQFVAEEEDEERVLWKDRSRATPKAIDVVLRHIRRPRRAERCLPRSGRDQQKASRLVEALMDAGFEVWFVRPQQVDLLRRPDVLEQGEGRSAGRACDGRPAPVDALGIGPARVLQPERAELRSLTRARKSLSSIDRAAEQASEHVHDCFPELLEIVKPNAQWFTLTMWRLVRTPAGARATSLDDIRSLLKASRVRKITPEEVHARLVEATDYCGQGDWTLVVELELERLELVRKQIKRLEATIAGKLDAIHWRSGFVAKRPARR
ncbi:MAG: hypothetical protein R3F59_04695 [Myxococcota bacterium]